MVGAGPLFAESGEGEVLDGWVRTGAMGGVGERAGSGDGGRVGMSEVTGIVDEGQRYQKRVKKDIRGSSHNSALSRASSSSWCGALA